MRPGPSISQPIAHFPKGWFLTEMGLSPKSLLNGTVILFDRQILNFDKVSVLNTYYSSLQRLIMNIRIVTSLNLFLQVPEETCTLEPQRQCKFVTKLVPILKPRQECVDVPKEVCSRSRGNPRPEKKPVVKKWCYVPSPESGLA